MSIGKSKSNAIAEKIISKNLIMVYILLSKYLPVSLWPKPGINP
jgi:hypothetical protein